MAPHVRYNFSANASDHCETPEKAYVHIAPWLAHIAKLRRKRKADLAIYDPYYCQGGVIKRLAAAGFPNVYNKNEDFYAVIRESRVPKHDVLLTNPAYSGDHIVRLVNFCCKQVPQAANGKDGCPWMLLLPNYVYTKAWFKKLMSVKGEIPLFLCPKGKRYQYESLYEAEAFSGKESDVVSPFASFWYIGGLGDLRQPLLDWFAAEQREGRLTDCTLASSCEELPRDIRKLERFAEKKTAKKDKALARKAKASAKKERRNARKIARQATASSKTGSKASNIPMQKRDQEPVKRRKRGQRKARSVQEVPDKVVQGETKQKKRKSQQPAKVAKGSQDS